MKKLMLAFAFTAAVIGCNKTTTTSTGISPRTGETVTKSLSLMSAEAQTIERGGKDDVLVTINRDNFNDPVTITLTDLPKGITIEEKELVIPASGVKVTAKLAADKDAAVGEHMVTITAKAEGMKENQQKFKLTVK